MRMDYVDVTMDELLEMQTGAVPVRLRLLHRHKFIVGELCKYDDLWQAMLLEIK